MSQYAKQEVDFITRTLKIIDQYESINTSKDERYEITLLLNCMVGLLILSQQQWFSNLPKEIVSRKEWGIEPSHISFIKEGKLKSINEIARHLRNSLAHSKFTVFANKSSKISQIKFKDFDSQGNLTFEAMIPIINLKSFLKTFANTMLDIMGD